jgi:hypothetical protein
MRGGSASRRVARAAAAGGGKVRGTRVPIGWYTTLAVVVVLGIAVVAFSRYERQHPVAAHVVQPAVGTRWADGFAFDVCGKLLPNPPRDPSGTVAGIYTDGDGVIHVDPHSKADAGHHATLGKFVSLYPGMVLGPAELRYPGGRLWRNGDRCGTKPGRVEVEVWDSLAATTGHVVRGDPADLRLGNGQLITLGFVPSGTALRKPPPSVIANLLTAMGKAAPSSTSTVPPVSPPSTAPPSTAPPSTAPPSTAPPSTGKPASPGTTAPSRKP